MKNESEKTGYEALCQVIREAKHLSKEKRNDLLFLVNTHCPKLKRVILESEINEWLEAHKHPEKKPGCIGGRISKTECYTTLGTMETYMCGACGEHAWVDYEF